VTNEVIAVGGGVFLVVAFVWLLFVFRAPAHLKQVLAVSQEASAILRDSTATDDAKEQMAQKCSVKLFGLFLLIVLTFVGALLAPVAVLWVLDFLHLISLPAVIHMTTSVTFLVTCTVVGCLISFLWPRLRARWTPRAK
jgi:hypothetical protein